MRAINNPICRQYAFQSSSTPMRPIPIRHQQQTHVRRLEERVPNAQRRYEPAPRPAAQRPDSRMPPPPLPVPPSVQQTPRESRRVVALPGQSQPVKVIPQNGIFSLQIFYLILSAPSLQKIGCLLLSPLRHLWLFQARHHIV